MRLLTVGDSFTYGEELSDLNNAWPFLLGKKLGYEVTNLAKPGSGNTRMVRHCVEHINDYDIAIVAWSHFARIEMADENGCYDVWPGSSPRVNRGWGQWRNELVDYLNRHHNDNYLYRQYLLNIILIQSFFKANHKRYLMVDSFGNHQDKSRTANANKDLLTQIDGNFYIGWPTESMMEWTYNTPQGPGGHFLERGHQIIANKINEHIRHLGWVS